jgi:hypothetical protein
VERPPDVLVRAPAEEGARPREARMAGADYDWFGYKVGERCYRWELGSGRLRIRGSRRPEFFLDGERFDHEVPRYAVSVRHHRIDGCYEGEVAGHRFRVVEYNENRTAFWLTEPDGTQWEGTAGYSYRYDMYGNATAPEYFEAKTDLACEDIPAVRARYLHGGLAGDPTANWTAWLQERFREEAVRRAAGRRGIERVMELVLVMRAGALSKDEVREILSTEG